MENEEVDPVIRAISQTGCLNLHNAVQECMFEHKDWRKCRDQVSEFKSCLAEHQKTKSSTGPPILKTENSNEQKK